MTSTDTNDLNDDALCDNQYPGDADFAGQLCDQPSGHNGDHKALVELGPGWRRHLTWQ